MVLPVKIEPYEDEAFKSWAHRLSAPYLLSPEKILSEKFYGRQSINDIANSKLLKSMSQLSGIGCQTLVSFFGIDIFLQEFLGVRSSVKNLWHTKLPTKHCPECWKEDNKENRPQYLRKNWMEPWRIICPKHSIYFRDHEFNSERGRGLFSHKQKSFLVRKLRSEFTDTNEISDMAKEYQRAYLDLFETDPIHELLNPDWKCRRDIKYNKIHTNIEGFIAALDVLLVNQYPVLRKTFLDWFSYKNNCEPNSSFPTIESGSPKNIVATLTNDKKILCINLILPLFLKDTESVSSLMKLLTSSGSPFKDTIDCSIHEGKPFDYYRILLNCVRQDMWEETISLLRNRKNILVQVAQSRFEETCSESVLHNV